MSNLKTQRQEIHRLVTLEFQRLREQHKNSVNGDVLWSQAKKYVDAQIHADWLIFQSNYNIGAFK
jgi:hypothetical protein